MNCSGVDDIFHAKKMGSEDNIKYLEKVAEQSIYEKK